MAGAIAAALGAEKLDLPHRRRRPAGRRRRPRRLIASTSARRAPRPRSPTAPHRRHDPQGRRLPRRRARAGCGSAHLLDGRIPHVLLLELFTDAGIGTMVTRIGAGRMSPTTTPRPDDRPSSGHPPTAGAAGRHRPLPVHATYGPPPVTFVRGRGTELWDGDGKRYLDFLSGLAVPSLGHAHPEVADAIAEQARTLLHVSNLFGTEPGAEVAATLDRLLGRRRARSSSATRAPRPTRRHQAGPQVGRPRPLRRRERLRLLPRADARHAPRHRPADQARGVPTAARGLPPRGVERPRRARRAPSTRGRRRAARAPPGRRRA